MESSISFAKTEICLIIPGLPLVLSVVAGVSSVVVTGGLVIVFMVVGLLVGFMVTGLSGASVIVEESTV